MEEKFVKIEPMKQLFTSAKIRSLCSVIFALAFQASMCQSHADTVANQNSVYTFDFTGGGGLTGWAVDGQNQVVNQWFYFRIGGGVGEQAINAISAPVVNISSSGSQTNLTVGYTNAALSVSIQYSLTGSNNNRSGYSELVSVFNYTATNMDLHFFDYSHFSLGGGNQTIRIGTAGPKPNAINQTNSSGAFLVETLSSIGSTPLAQIGAGGTLLASLTDGSPTSLSPNILGPQSGPDLETAFEFDWSVAANAATGKSISTAGPIIVPEPSALALIVLGLGALGLRRKRQSQT